MWHNTLYHCAHFFRFILTRNIYFLLFLFFLDCPLLLLNQTISLMKFESQWRREQSTDERNYPSVCCKDLCYIMDVSCWKWIIVSMVITVASSLPPGQWECQKALTVLNKLTLFINLQQETIHSTLGVFVVTFIVFITINDQYFTLCPTLLLGDEPLMGDGLRLLVISDQAFRGWWWWALMRSASRFWWIVTYCSVWLLVVCYCRGCWYRRIMRHSLDFFLYYVLYESSQLSARNVYFLQKNWFI